jgi:predicted transcriptional regulator
MEHHQTGFDNDCRTSSTTTDQQNFKDLDRKSKSPAPRTKRVEVLPGSEQLLKQLTVVLTVAGYDQRRIAHQLGVSQPTISRWLREPEAEHHQRLLSRQLTDGAVLLLRRYSIEAVETLVEVMRLAESQKTRLDAAKAILDRIGLPGTLDLVNTAEAAEAALDVSQEDEFFARFRAAPPEVQNEVATLYEQMESLLCDYPPA